jgi:hypothetical protein
MGRLDEDDEEGKENIGLNTFGNSKGFGSTPKPEPVPVMAWMVIHGGDFADVAKDLAGFRRLFTKSVSAAIGIPVGCIEVQNITRGSIVVEFLIHPPLRGGDTRDVASLVLSLENQLRASYSALRKGPFGPYAESAELLAGNPSRAATPPGMTPTHRPFNAYEALPDFNRGYVEMGVQTEPFGAPGSAGFMDTMPSQVDMLGSTMGSNFGVDVNIAFAGQRGNAGDPVERALQVALDDARNRADRAEANERSLRNELVQKDQLIARLQAQLVAQ